MTVDVELRNLFQEVGLKWTDFEGAASSRLFQAICIATRDQVTLFVESPAQRYPKASDNLHQLLQDFVSLPVWSGTSGSRGTTTRLPLSRHAVVYIAQGVLWARGTDGPFPEKRSTPIR